MNDTIKNLFWGRKLVIASKHEKEAVMAPLLAAALGIEVIAGRELDTDQFGTFSGEVERSVSPTEAARQKCRAACQMYNCTLAVASEGSFGPHPEMPLMPCNQELVLLSDLEHGLEIKAMELTADTNFNGKLVHTNEEAENFAKAVLFPKHGLILRKDRNDNSHLAKGIITHEELTQQTSVFLKTYGQVFIETDMRAMYNPTRMAVIGRVTEKLIKNILRQCPQCGCPGFSITEVVDGLPCSLCGNPTKGIMAFVFSCQKCTFKEYQNYPQSKTTEDPLYCDYCNP
jgi:hypothetical protein